MWKDPNELSNSNTITSIPVDKMKLIQSQMEKLSRKSTINQPYETKIQKVKFAPNSHFIINPLMGRRNSTSGKLKVRTRTFKLTSTRDLNEIFTKSKKAIKLEESQTKEKLIMPMAESARLYKLNSDMSSPINNELQFENISNNTSSNEKEKISSEEPQKEIIEEEKKEEETKNYEEEYQKIINEVK
ncbi:MAG: hypothetical protein MJ252_12515 [archaeon]|nr:hypothetical protein [archaeon]